MGLAIATESLTKVYTSTLPSGSNLRERSPSNGAPGGKRSHETTALAGLTLRVEAGEIFGVLGPNGAGKSTAVGVLTTRVRPTSGRAWIGDVNVWEYPIAARRVIGVVPQRPNLDFALTAREVLTFHGAYFGLRAAECRQRADVLLDRLQLTDRADQLTTGFSGGLMQRLSIARALVHRPSVLFLDEPSAGLDPQTRLLLEELIQEYSAAGDTVLLTTHNIEEADRLCHRIAIIDRGRVIAVGTPRELKQTMQDRFVVRLRVDAVSSKLVETCRALVGVTGVCTVAGDCLDVFTVRGGAMVPAIASAAANAGAMLRDLNISEPSLASLFLHLTGTSLRE